MASDDLMGMSLDRIRSRAEAVCVKYKVAEDDAQVIFEALDRLHSIRIYAQTADHPDRLRLADYDAIRELSK